MASSKDILCPRKECSRKLGEKNHNGEIEIRHPMGRSSWPITATFKSKKLRLTCTCGMLGIYDVKNDIWEVAIRQDNDAMIVLNEKK